MDQHPQWLYDTVVISLFLHGSWLPNSKGDGFRYRATTHKVAWFFDHLIICRVMVNKKRCISNSKSPMDTELDRVVTYDMSPPLKKSHQPQSKALSIHSFFLPQQCTFNYTQGHCKIALVSKKIGATNTSISKSLCDLTWNSLWSLIAGFCITTFIL